VPTLEQRADDILAVMDADRGRHGLKGVPDEWQLFAVEHT
jgi:hypothetical protein